MRPLTERFWEKVDKRGPDECWLWLACTDGRYGRFRVKTGNDGYRVAHRVAYELLVGPIPEGLQLDHLCMNKVCVNPAHLEPVTGAENTRRGQEAQRRGRYATHCVNGHAFTIDNTYKRSTGGRACWTCADIRHARRPKARSQTNP